MLIQNYFTKLYSKFYSDKPHVGLQAQNTVLILQCQMPAETQKMVKLKIACAIFLTLCYLSPPASGLTQEEKNERTENWIIDL